MNNEEVLNMDPMILLSIINMKLRDQYGSLDLLCDDLNIDKNKIIDRLNNIGFEYVESLNAFK